MNSLKNALAQNQHGLVWLLRDCNLTETDRQIEHVIPRPAAGMTKG